MKKNEKLDPTNQEMARKEYDIPLTKTITTANKNIHSFFMRSDNSYFVKENECYPAYKTMSDRVVVVKMLCDTVEVCDFTESISECSGSTTSESISCSENMPAIKTYQVDGLFSGNVFSPVSTADLLLKLCSALPCFSNHFICLVFKDTLRRSELLFMINILLNYKSGKGILLLPESLAICINLSVQNSIVIYAQDDSTYITIVEDYVMMEIKQFKEEKECNITLFRAEEEFIDEFDPWGEYKINKMFMCDLCVGWFTHESALLHVIKKHMKSGKCDCEKNKNSRSEDIINSQKNVSDDTRIASTDGETEPAIAGDTNKNAVRLCKSSAKKHTEESFNQSDGNVSFIDAETVKSTNISDSIKEHAKKHIKYIFKGNTIHERIACFFSKYFNKEKLKKINTVIGPSHVIEALKDKFSNLKFIDIDTADRMKGARDLVSVDVSRELWMTDKEWNAARIRILKEKLLFYL